MNRGCVRWILFAFVAFVALLVGLFFWSRPQGVTRLPAVPSELQTLAVVPGFPNTIRYFPTDATHEAQFEKDYLASNDRELLQLHKMGQKDDTLPPISFLAISGGGDNGAFGAGLLNGWSATGERPAFKLVTGVSTGALIAPFAFLGPAYDPTIKSIYTGISFRDIAMKRSPLWVVFGDSMADNAPLKKLVKKTVTREVLDAIANERDKGRVLLIATTNLDARRPVIWNVTEIAAARSDLALELVQKILIASSAIPGTFPPVMIDVLAGARPYQEMHVDGATASQVFVYPTAMHLHQLAPRKRTLYVIRNARLDPEWAQVERRTVPIAFRAISTLVQFQGIGDLYTIYTITQRDHLKFNLAFIPPTFDYPHKQLFDTKYMRELFAVGERMAVRGTDWWWKHPPVLLSGVGENEQSE
ncbi:MAG TPA: patatin-like phospholipase family protein [Thermoanaerobaculia bacterium]